MSREFLSNRSEPVTEVVKVRSVFTPRWWQVRFRLRMRRLRRAAARHYEGLTPEGRVRVDGIVAASEREFLFGRGDGEAR